MVSKCTSNHLLHIVYIRGFCGFFVRKGEVFEGRSACHSTQVAVKTASDVRMSVLTFFLV